MRDDEQHIEDVFRIEEIKSELAELSDGQFIMEKTNEVLPPEIEKQFLEQVLAYETAELITHKELLARDGVQLPPPDEMDDDELSLKLIEVIHTLDGHHFYLENTNHLSDRQLYTELWEDGLNESEPLVPPEFNMNYHLDMVGSGSEPHLQLWLTYYADEEARLRWKNNYPELEIPPHQDPLYDRDRHLPKPPEPPNPYDDPEVEKAWWNICREKLERKLASDGITAEVLGDEPLSYAPDFACVWALGASNSTTTPDWWAISGELPTTYLPTADYPDPRSFLQAVRQHWLAAADAMEEGNPSAELTLGLEKDWPRIIPLLRYYADYLNDWANEDEAWEEE